MLAGQMQGSYRAQMESAAAQQDARFVLEEVTRYLRQAGNNPYRIRNAQCPGNHDTIHASPIGSRHRRRGGRHPHSDGRQPGERPASAASPGLAASSKRTWSSLTTRRTAPSRSAIPMAAPRSGRWPTGSSPTCDSHIGIQSRNVTANAQNVAFIQTTVTVAHPPQQSQPGPSPGTPLVPKSGVRSR